MSVSPEDELAVSNLVDEMGWEATTYSLLRRATVAEKEVESLRAENVRLRRDVDDLTSGWKPLAVRVMEGMMMELGRSLSECLNVLVATSAPWPPGLDRSVQTLKNFRKTFPKLAGVQR